MKEDFDLAGKVIGYALKVHRTLGPGFLESVYKNALSYELRKPEFNLAVEEPIRVFYDDVGIGHFLCDLFIEQSLIVELKAVLALSTAHEVQLVNYLNATGKDEGVLINSGAQSLEFKKKFRTSSPNSVNSVNSV